MIAAAAIDYGRRGWRVFGVASDCRSPIKVKGEFEHGVHDATADPEAIRLRWVRHPKANVALACGPESGVFVLDVDAKGDVDGFESLHRLEQLYGGRLPPSWRVRTPSGGVHLYFRQPPRHLRNKVGLRIYHDDGSRTVFPGLDIRSAGASVALPPSRKPHGPYEWEVGPDDVELADAPEWLIALAVDPPAPPRRPPPPLRLNDLDRTARYVAAAVDSECTTLAAMRPNTGRNQRLFQAAANLGEFVGAGLLPLDAAEHALEEAALQSGLLQEDGAHSVRMTIASGMRRGMTNPREVRQ